MNVYLPKDRVTNQHQGYGFVEFRTEDDADYVRKLLPALAPHATISHACATNNNMCDSWRLCNSIHSDLPVALHELLPCTACRL